MKTTVTTFANVQLDQTFYFRFGIKGERGPCIKVSKRSYVYAADVYAFCSFKINKVQRHSVGTVKVEVRVESK